MLTAHFIDLFKILLIFLASMVFSKSFKLGFNKVHIMPWNLSVPYFSGEYQQRVLLAVAKFLFQKNHVNRLPTPEDYSHLDHALGMSLWFHKSSWKWWGELGVPLLIAFSIRHDEKQRINQSEVTWKWDLILNQWIKIDVPSGNIF